MNDLSVLKDEVRVGIFAAENDIKPRGQANIHGIVPLSYAQFCMRLISRRDTPNWVIYVQDTEENIYSQMRGRKRYDREK